MCYRNKESESVLFSEQNSLKRKHPESTINNLHKESMVNQTEKPKEAGKEKLNGPKTTPVPRAVIFPESDKNRTLPASVSREFAEEFHKSVLQTTRQQQETKAGEDILDF